MIPQLLAQATDEGTGEEVVETAQEANGHFLDRFVGWVFDLDAGDSVFDFVADVFGWLVVVGVFAVPALLVLGGLRRRHYGLVAGGAVTLAYACWYRFLYTTADNQADIVSSGKVPVSDNGVLDQWTIPVGDWVEQTVFWVDQNMGNTLAVIRWPFEVLLDRIVDEWLVGMSWLSFCLGIFFLGWIIRNFKVGAVSFLALTICGLLGGEYWDQTVRTIGFIGVAVLLCVIIGIPIGILCGRVDGVWTTVRPVLDAMQVVHAFVYMLPFIFFFKIGVVSGTMVTMVFALPPLIRLTNLGIRQVPEDVVEAARSYGAPEWRVLMDVQLPLARPAIMTGLNQNLLLAISMLGTAAIMGAPGLGRLLFRAISNLDIALAASAGLAFFLVAVVLDRLTQPEADDGLNLFGRIAQAWSHRKSPEDALAASEALADAARAAKQIEKPKPVERFKPVEGSERLPIMVTLGGALVTLVGVLLPWTTDAGLVSAYARRVDEALPGGSFNGVSPSGGSWFGIFVLVMLAVALIACVATWLAPGRQSRWLSADGAAISMMAAAITVFVHIVASPPDAAVGYGRGIGVFVALIGSVVGAAAALRWTWTNPVTARTPLQATIGWGRIIGATFALVVLLMGAYSGWTFDTRADSVITPELQQELDEIQERARLAEAEGDLGLAGTLAAEYTAKISEAQRTGDIIYDGFTGSGAGLGVWVLLFGAAAVALTLFGSGVIGIDEHLRYRWTTVAMGVGTGIAMVGAAWIGSIARVADPNFVSGIGSVLVMAAGTMLLSTGVGTVGLFLRDKVYGEDAEAATTDGDTVAEPALVGT